MQHLAPIALFVYNRPEHTRRTISHLQKNLLADESRLIIFSDAPKSEKDKDSVERTREFIKTVDGFKSIRIVERTQNMGLAESIIDGVSQLTEEYGKVIVFEDDLLTSPYTLKYFNQALKRYQGEDRVMQIGGYMFPLQNEDQLPNTFFFRATSSWGWATWKRAWDKFEPNINTLYKQFDRQKIREFSINGKMNYWNQFMDFKNNKNNSWAIRWYASVFLNKGLVLYPAKSLIDNIGHDGTGVHSNIEDTYQVSISREPIESYPDEIEENKIAYQAILHFFKHRKGSWLKRGKKFLINKWVKLIRKS